jgi:hypothetical protein
MLNEGLLKWMKLALMCEALNSSDAPSLILDRQCETGDDALSVGQHRAGAACSLVASLLRARQIESLPQEIQQGHSRIVGQLGSSPIDHYQHGGSLSSGAAVIQLTVRENVRARRAPSGGAETKNSSQQAKHVPLF